MSGLNFGGSLFGEGRREEEDEILIIPHTSFVAQIPATADIDYEQTRVDINVATNMYATVWLPHNVTILKVGLSGNGSGTWTLHRINKTGTINQAVATGTVNATESDANELYSFVDNTTYRYNFRVTNTANGDDIKSAYITYTRRGKQNARN